MERWAGRVGIVTGASSGLGAAIAEMMVKHGIKVIGAARRVERIQAMAERLAGEKGSLIPCKCDLTKDEDIYAMFDMVKENYGGVDICINNAGMTHCNSLQGGTPDEWRNMVNLNIVALSLCTKLTIQSLKDRHLDDGQIINISSISARKSEVVPIIRFYAGTKYAVSSITEGFRLELKEEKSHIKISTLSPGLVKTEILSPSMNEQEQIINELFKINEYLTPEEVAYYAQVILSAPPHIEINDIMLKPTMTNEIQLPNSAMPKV